MIFRIVTSLLAVRLLAVLLEVAVRLLAVR